MDGATVVLFQYGLAGVVIFGLSLTVVVQYKDNKALQSRLDAEKDGRRSDAINTLDKVTEPLKSISQTTNFIYDKLAISKKAEGR